jgi:alpha-methylacyl-CoA racemase
MAGIGPAPFTAMVLADMGADIVRIDRSSGGFLRGSGNPTDFLNRSRRSTTVDLKNPDGVELVLRLVERADGLVEGFRPGVMERLGLGPDLCLERNPALVYGRMTGWGQEGPQAKDVGHDINYAALTGALHSIGRAGQPPTPPVNYLADFGGGGLLLAFGMVTALLERSKSGRGQVVDAAMIDGVSLLSAAIFGAVSSGFWHIDPGTNMLDSGSHFYDVYATADGKWVSVGAIEPQFYTKFLELIGLEGEDLSGQMDQSRWPELKKRVASIFESKTRDEWCELMEGHEVCFAPVLTFEEAPEHPHNKQRSTFVEYEGTMQPAPAPRFSRTPAAISRVPSAPGADTDEVLADWGVAADEIERLRGVGALG